jgi:arginase
MKSDTLRLIMPQWQGGNEPSYSFGTKLLSFLAPSGKNDMEVEVPVEPYDEMPLPMEHGVIAHSVLLRQLKSASKIIEAYQPERIITFGGDCLVSQAPFAYLNEKHNGKLGVLWLDAHPDVSTPDMFQNIHAMVLGNLLGEGEKDFAAEVKVPLNPELVMYGGLQEMTPQESQIVERLNIRKAGSKELAENSQPILDWIKNQEIKHLAIHLDLDVLNPRLFRSLLFAKPEGEPIQASQGDMSFSQIERIIQEVSQQTEIVGFTIAEYLPWDALNFYNFLKKLPVFQ